MKERGILFTPENYTKCENGNKRQTRRLVKPHPPCECEYIINGAQSHALCRSIHNHDLWVPPTAKSKDHRLACPFGTVGDRLYVKEGLERYGLDTDRYEWRVRYRRDKETVGRPGEHRWRWQRPTLSPLHMPKWAARIWLELVEVRVERVQDISDLDARAEGCEPAGDNDGAYRKRFEWLWESINGEGSWKRNDWVWVLSYKKLTPAHDQGGA